MADDRKPVVLLMTDLIDPTGDRVEAELERRGVRVFRCNPGDFPQLVTLVGRIDQSGVDGSTILLRSPEPSTSRSSWPGRRHAG